MQTRDLGSQRITPVIQALNPLRMLERCQQAQDRAFVQAGALGQLSQGEGRVVLREYRHEAHGAVNGRDATLGRIGIRDGLRDGLTRHIQPCRRVQQLGACSIL
ncbi:hypothetical protein D3C72_2051210 [compost metagenome]